MNGKMRIFLLLVIIVSMLTIETESAFACSCAPPGPIDEELTNAAAVFTGKVVGLADQLSVLASSALEIPSQQHSRSTRCGKVQ